MHFSRRYPWRGILFCFPLRFPRQLAELAKQRHPTVSNIFLLGHSMGGAIAIEAARKANDGTFKAVAISAALLGVDPSIAKPWMVWLSHTDSHVDAQAGPGADVGGGEPSPGADVGGGEPSPGVAIRAYRIRFMPSVGRRIETCRT